MLYGRLVHVGEIINRFWAVNCAKMRLATGPGAGAIALRRPRSRYEGERGRVGEGKGWKVGRGRGGEGRVREGRGGEEGREMWKRGLGTCS